MKKLFTMTMLALLGYASSADAQNYRKWDFTNWSAATIANLASDAEAGVTGHTVAKHLRERLGFLPKGDVFPIGALPRTEGKAKRVIRRTAQS